MLRRPRPSLLLVALACATLTSLAASSFAAGSPADLVLPPLDRGALPPPAWPELGSATLGMLPEMGARARGDVSPLRIAQPSNVSAAANWSFESDVASRQLGSQVEPVGDLNGDGYSDFAAVGSQNLVNTVLYIFFGSPTGPSLAPGYPVTSLPSGGAIAPAGDVNGDGRDDLLLFWIQSGNVRLYFGSTSGVDLVSFNNLGAHFPANMFGMNAGPAGDVNGDGYGDVLFGLPNHNGLFPCGTSPNSGLVEVLYGSASGISAANTWVVTGCYATGPGSTLGASATGAGDVNGDGYDDIVFGAPGADLNLVGTVGKVYVMYGAAAGFPKLPGFANLGAVTLGTTIAGHHLFASFGASVCAAGDLNGDGYADIAVGAPTDDNYGTDAGLAMVFRGSSAGVDTAQADLLWWESAGVANAQFGRTVVPAGDVNGDGRPDLLVGETNREDLAQSAGSTLIISQTLPYTATSNPARTAGDVNGDGMSDLLIGDPAFTNGQSTEGRVLVHFGAASPPSSSPNWSLTQSVIDNPNLGWSVASAGDVNGDGYEDVLVGEPTWYNFTVPGSTNNGLVQLFYGHATGLSPSYDWFQYGVNGDQLGISVTGMDLNGDGFSDVVVGAHTANGNVGHVCIWYGSSTGPSPAGPNVTLNGFGPGTRYFGNSVAPAGDTNGDGYPDLVVGEPYGVDPLAPLAEEGRAYVYRGSAAGIVTTPIWATSGHQAGAHLGQSVAGAGDMNGDGYADVVLGAPGYDNLGKFGVVYTDGGRLIVGLGSPGGPSTELVSAMLGDNFHFGSSVAGAGDVNGDGYSDVIGGAPDGVNTQPGEGMARVVIGSAGGIGGVLWTQFGGEAYGGFGSAVSSAGDADGDGLSDVLVGAVFQDMGGPQDQGRAYIFRGPLPAGASAFWTASGNSNFANLGHSLANAGDVNGDGWTDLVFGMPGYNGTGYRQGLARVYYGAQGTSPFQLLALYHLGAPSHFVQPGCLSDPGSLAILSTGRSAAGRAKVRLQYQVKPVVGLPAPPMSGFSSFSATGSPGSNGSLAGIIFGVPGLTAGVPYSYAVRTLSKNVFFPSGPWRTAGRSGRLETDFRVPGSYLDAGDFREPEQMLLADVRPNPMTLSTSVVFALTRAGDVSLAVHDVQGRRVRTLAHGAMSAGEHRVTWDGSSDDGVPASAGVYLVRLEAEGRTLSRKLVRVR